MCRRTCERTCRKRKDNFGSKSHEQHEMDVRPGT
ncbi:MAG: hypothetical protein ACLTEU_07325 [Roseburia inulinivorans]|nr:hypothetical protein [Roseburia sp.]